jgi:outer membrane protein
VKTTSLLVSSLALAAGLVHAQSQPAKVGVINIQRALVSTKEGQKAAAELQARTDPKRKELERKQSEIQGLQEQLRKQSNTASDEVKQRLMREIDAKTKSFNRDMEDAQAEADQEQGKVLQELGGKMMAVIDKYARDNGYALIVDVSAQNTPVLFASPSIEVTDEIIAMYDKNAPAAAPPPASKPAAQPPAAAPSPKPTTQAPAATPPPATSPAKKQPGPPK